MFDTNGLISSRSCLPCFNSYSSDCASSKPISVCIWTASQIHISNILLRASLIRKKQWNPCRQIFNEIIMRCLLFLLISDIRWFFLCLIQIAFAREENFAFFSAWSFSVKQSKNNRAIAYYQAMSNYPCKGPVCERKRYKILLFGLHFHWNVFKRERY